MKTGLGELRKIRRIVCARDCFCRALDTVYVKLSENFRVFAKYFSNLAALLDSINGAPGKNLRVCRKFFSRPFAALLVGVKAAVLGTLGFLR